ncbi:MAG: cyclodeaminase/cyclohydrolase family protein [Armatimonadetes bacterium]|nr:cyclodeaminase/cyclohydrolase family protein [Armatimonadota bacterium]
MDSVVAKRLTVEEYLDKLAARLPAPGGGSASALVGAAGAALAAMVANFTVGNPKYTAVEADVQRVLEEVEAHRSTLMDLIQADMDAYSEVSAAYKLPKEDPSRTEAIQKALRLAADPPRRIIEHCLAVLRLLPELLEKGNQNLVSDGGVAASLAHAALKCAWLNVEINLAHMDDSEYVADERERLRRSLEEAERLAAAVWTETVRRVVGE